MKYLEELIASARPIKDVSWDTVFDAFCLKPTADELEELATAARPINDADDGTARQIAAEIAFFKAVDRQLVCSNLTIEETDGLDAFCHKATADERISEGLRLAALAATRLTP